MAMTMSEVAAFLTNRGGADGAPDPGQDGLDAFFRGWARLFGGAMEISDGCQATAER
jgi:hypothetical protein